ncbi:MAG: 16S rRNA (cytosine(1402)-N(4))-methyltransferase RsmH [Muribaculaceae bacterium]|nr:16S rRNA (cytosine(1402)-N(4))-methyltransferase RsmH [Muribaculaceae bacterium]
MNAEVYHIPALLEQSINGLNISPKGIYIDVTFGGGGHSRAILEKLGPDGILFGFDRDKEAFRNAPDDLRFTFVHSNFRYITNFMRFHRVEHVDGILADLGVSFHHFDDAQRGFSFRNDAPLDMRMNQSAPTTASDIVANYSEEQLTALFKTFTDLKRPGTVARAIVNARADKPVDTTFRLADVVRPTLNPKGEKKELAQVFQALRIEVNGEMDALRRFLESTVKLIKPGGRLAIITYHSIEDRMVKNFMKTGNIEGIEDKDFFGRVSSPWKLITRSPITPSEEEVERNPRSRSAKLRIAELVQ